jgi:hypothetical protein
MVLRTFALQKCIFVSGQWLQKYIFATIVPLALLLFFAKQKTQQHQCFNIVKLLLISNHRQKVLGLLKKDNF